MLCIGFACVFTPWAVRNYKVFHAFVPVQVRAGEAFWASNNPWSKGRQTQEHYDIENLSGLSELEKDKRMSKWAVNYLKTLSPAQLIKLYSLKASTFIYPFLSEYGFKYDLTFGMLIPFWLFGMFIVVRQKNTDGLLLLSVLLTFFISTLIYYGGEIRFRMGYSPYIIVFAALGLTNFSGLIRNKKMLGTILSFWLAVNILACFYYKPVYSAAKLIFESIRSL
jgi:hypothetical protein